MSERGPEQIRVVLAEANEADVEKIVGVLRESGMQTVFETVQSEEGLAAAIETFQPDVVISDNTLPLLDYRTALKVVQEVSPWTPVIVVGGLLRNEDSGSFVRAGAESFVSKLNLSVLPLAVRSAIEARAPLLKLTTRQMEVMRLVASGYRTRDVAQVLNLSEKTVETHRHQLMRKLGFETTASLVRYAMRCGLALASPIMTM